MTVSGAIAEHPGPGSLGPDQVHLWSIQLGDTPGTATRLALREILAGYLGVPAAQVSLVRAPAGKPRLAAGTRPAINFNLSHSGALALIGVSVRESVGVDIEHLRARPRERLFGRVLDPAEEAVVRACSPAERERAFLRHWTAKEACVKARGIGLVDDLRALRITDALSERPAASGLGMDDLYLQRYDPCAETVGTVAVSGGPWQAVPLTLVLEQ